MKILILGNDGYIGFPLTLHLLRKGHEVLGVDNYSRRRRVSEVGGDSLTPIDAPSLRKHYLKNKFSNYIDQVNISLGDDSPGYIQSVLKSFKPDTIVHLAEMPSAPWSMMGPQAASITQRENVIGTLHLLWAMKEECPEAHLVKLGTMGEYGTPECDIPEGRIPADCIGGCEEVTEANYGEIEKEEICQCPMKGLLFPRTPGSFYHLSKVMDTFNIEFCCRNWGLRSTDIMQGVLFGLLGKGDEMTRFDYDEHFGTAINRFCVQALIDFPFTIYGKGGQTRGYLPLKDSIQCLTIALENPPALGEYRTLNQFENTYSINQLASLVQDVATEMDLISHPGPIPNPRNEAEEHYYNPYHQTLFDLGYIPTTDIRSEIKKLLTDLLPYKDKIIKDVILPRTTWR